MTLNRIRSALALAGAVLAAGAIPGCVANRMGGKNEVKTPADKPDPNRDLAYEAMQRQLDTLKREGWIPIHLLVRSTDETPLPAAEVEWKYVTGFAKTKSTEEDGWAHFSILSTHVIRWRARHGSFNGGAWVEVEAPQFLPHESGQGIAGIITLQPRAVDVPPPPAAAPKPPPNITYPPEVTTVAQKRTWLWNQIGASLSRGNKADAEAFGAAYDALPTE